MADKNIVKQEIAERRRRRVRGRVLGTAERPRLTVVKSLKNVFAQLVDDEKRVTILGVGTQSTTLKGSASGKSKVEAAKLVGMKIAEMAKAKGIEKVVFDRNRFRYHGRVKALADGAREGGLQF